MAERYHTNDQGKTLRCTADKQECRFVHGSTAAEAAENWQQQMADGLLPKSARVEAVEPRSTEEILRSRYSGEFFGEQGEGVKLELSVDPATQSVIDRLLDAGLNPLVAGGAVRDAIMGKQPKDFDIEVHGAKSFDELRSTLKGLGPLNITGRDFGVMKLRVKLPDGKLSEEIDLALPRRDSKTGSGHTGFTVEVDPEMGLKEATARRDLTVNALMWDPRTGVAMDLHGGLRDMGNGRLRHVSEAFSEDPLRVLRVARFAAKLNFEAEAETVELSRELRGSFDELAKERIVGEMSRMLLEPSVDRGMDFLRSSGWGEPMGIADSSYGSLGPSLKRGQEIGKELPTEHERRSLQLALMATQVPDSRRTLSYFAANKAESKSALALASASKLGSPSPAEARQWAWDHRPTTARQRISLERALGRISDEDSAGLKSHFDALGVLDGNEKDRFDSQALIKEHRAANPGLKDGSWILDFLQEHRTRQYDR